MSTFSEQDLQVFLDNQLQLFPEPVAETLEEAEYFLEDCMVILCKNKKEVKQYFLKAEKIVIYLKRVKEVLIKRYKKPMKEPIIDEETGEVLKDTETTMACILIDDNNKSYATGSKVFTIQMMRYLQMFGINEEGFEIKIVKNKTEKGNKSLGFELV